MAFFRQYIAPLIVVFVFLLALVAASARIFLPMDMAAPAPIEEMSPAQQAAQPAPRALMAPSVNPPPGALSPAVFSKKLQAPAS